MYRVTNAVLEIEILTNDEKALTQEKEDKL